jgi:sodium/bile acid cotransporter 7
MTALRTWLAGHWFLLGLAGAVALAFVAPEPGAADGWLQPRVTTKAGVALIFFIQGLSMNLAELRAGVAAWRLHLLVQGFAFGVFPLVGLTLDWLVGRELPVDLRLGFLFLCVLPTTVSTAVVFTALAGGNTAGAIFNATLSNVAGVIITPLWATWLLAVAGRSVPLLPVMAEISALLLVPLVAGQMVRPVMRDRAEGLRPWLRQFSSLIVLFIVYTAFAGSVDGGLWQGQGGGTIGAAGAGVVIVFAIIFAATALGARQLGLDRADRIAALMCAPQKTLAAGVPMAQLLFGAHSGLGLILLPVLLYHPLQLLACGLMIPRLRREIR